MVCRWAQERLGYNFTIVHRSNTMMVDVDALTWRFGHLISHHIDIADLLSSHDHAKCPRAYTAPGFSNLGNTKITETDNPSSNVPPILSSDVLHLFYQYITTNTATASSLEPSQSPSITTLPIQMLPYPNLCLILPLKRYVTPNTAMSALQTPQSLGVLFLLTKTSLVIIPTRSAYTAMGQFHVYFKTYLHILP